MFIDDRVECLEGAEKVGITKLIMMKHMDSTEKYTTINTLKELLFF